MLGTEDISKGVKAVAEDYPIKSVELFGSYASGKQTEKSDVDLLVEFKTPSVSLFTISSLQIRMEELLGTSVDVIHALVPEGSLIEIGRTVRLYEA